MRTIAIILLAACGAQQELGPSNGADAGASSDGGTSGMCFSSSECPTGWTCSEFHTCQPPPPPMGDAGTPPPPPPEVEYEYGPPISSQRYVYVAMTAQDELARIDGRTLAVTSTKVGKSPRIVSTIPHTDGAVVLDSQNGTATVVRPAGATDHVRVLGTLQHLNRLDIDPSGRFAVIWFDLAKAIQEGGINGIGSFQDVTVIDLTAENAVDLTVGFRPRNVQFDAAGNRAYVVTQDGVSIIDLVHATQQGPSIVPPLPVADPLIPPEDLEVHIVATGSYAVVRQANTSNLRVVSLVGATQGQAWTLPLASPATDIDLAPDGARVYVVQRTAKKLSIIDVPGDAITPSGVETLDLTNATLGSLQVSADGKRALLYTNATLDERITLIKLDQPGYPMLTWPLKKAVRAVGIAPTGDSAIVVHAKAPGDPATATTVDDYIDKSYGYSVLDLASGFAKLQVTAVDPGQFAYSLNGQKAYVALDGGNSVTAIRQVQLVTIHTGVVVSKQLGSPPSDVGILPGIFQAFVSQRHPLGRVTFIDILDDSIKTVTGFDLNSQVIN